MSAMKFQVQFLTIVSLVAITATTPLFADRYVAQGGQTPGGGYTAWSSAASNIHEAVGAATAGETVWVSNGWYKTPSTIAISQSLQLRAAEGNSQVLVDGNGARRILAVSVAQPMDVLIQGLILTNGYDTTAGAGIRVDHAAAVAATVTVRACVITHCRGASSVFDSKGGGIRIQGRTDSDDLFVHLDGCEVLHGFATSRGGGIKIIHARFLLEDCRVADNQTSLWDPFAVPSLNEVSPRWGGGIFVQNAGPGSIIRNCIVEGNRVNAHGGGIAVRQNGFLLENCVIRNNLAGMGGGVHVDSTLLNGVDPMIIRSCLISGNTTRTNDALTTVLFSNGGGVRLGLYPQSFVDGVKDVWIQNTTIVSNRVMGQAGGVYTSGGRAGTSEGDQGTLLLNTIVYGNTAAGTPASSNVYFDLTGPSTYSVTNSLIGTANALVGSGNLTTQSPAFADAAAGDYRLARLSPCVNSGTNQPWMTGSVDLNGRPRIDGGYQLVDMGCYEFVFPSGSLIVIR